MILKIISNTIRKNGDEYSVEKIDVLMNIDDNNDTKLLFKIKDGDILKTYITSNIESVGISNNSIICTTRSGSQYCIIFEDTDFYRYDSNYFLSKLTFAANNSSIWNVLTRCSTPVLDKLFLN